MVSMFGCDVRIPPHLTLQSWKSSHLATAAVKRRILSHAAVPSAAAHPGEPPLLCLVQDKETFSLHELAVFPVAYLHLQSPRSQKDSGNTAEVSLKRSVGEAWKCVTGGRETSQWEEQQSEPALVLPEVTPSHHHPAQAGRSILPWKTLGRQHLSSMGQPGEVSGDPGAEWCCRTFHPSTCGPSTRTCGAPTATMGGGCKRGPAPLVLPQLYYGGLSVGLIDIEPECAVRRLSVNYMWLSIYCFEHDLGLKHMNLLLVKTSSITFSWHQ